MSITAWKTIFSFSGRPEKTVFPKKFRWNMIFLVLLEKMIFLFPEIMILLLERKMKDYLSQENTWKYDVFFKCSEKIVPSFRKGLTSPGHDLSCTIWKNDFFFPKTWYFFLGRKMKDDLSQEIHGNMIFSMYLYGCYKRDTSPLCEKSQRWSYLAKIYLKVVDFLDCHSRKSPSNSLYFHGDLYRRFHILLSSKKKQETKYIYSVGGILQWIIFNTLYHSTLRSCIWRFAWAPFKEIICPLGDWL